MTISAKIIAHSIGPFHSKPIFTIECRYPRFIHAEELTHRVLETTPDEIIIQAIADGIMYDHNLSRNAASSRAIPIARMIQDILDDTAMPMHWGKNQPGMQAFEECNAPIVPPWAETDADVMGREEAWMLARDNAIGVARAFAEAGYHKQIVNRLLEPFMHINVLLTATEWDNFFELRDHPDAQPEIQLLARKIREAMDASTPKQLEDGQWHMPYIGLDDWTSAGDFITHNGVLRWNPTHEQLIKVLLMVSVARCASLSYKTVDGQPMTVERAVKLYDKLITSKPMHASPCEHQAYPLPFSTYTGSNFLGWMQYRKELEHR